MLAGGKKEKSNATKQEKKAAQTRRSLLNSAFALFAERGYERVTVEDITKHAGVSKGTFYFHFSAKEAVLTEYFLQIDDLYAESYSRMSKNQTTEKKLLRMVDILCAFCADQCGVEFLRVIYAHQLLHLHPDVSALHRPERKIIPILCEIAEDGKERGEMPKETDNELFAKEIMHLAHGIVYDWCAENGSFDLKKEGRRVFEQTLRMAFAYNKHQRSKKSGVE